MGSLMMLHLLLLLLLVVLLMMMMICGLQIVVFGRVSRGARASCRPSWRMLAGPIDETHNPAVIGNNFPSDDEILLLNHVSFLTLHGLSGLIVVVVGSSLAGAPARSLNAPV